MMFARPEDKKSKDDLINIEKEKFELLQTETRVLNETLIILNAIRNPKIISYLKQANENELAERLEKLNSSDNNFFNDVEKINAFLLKPTDEIVKICKFVVDFLLTNVAGTQLKSTITQSLGAELPKVANEQLKKLYPENLQEFVDSKTLHELLQNLNSEKNQKEIANNWETLEDKNKILVKANVLESLKKEIEPSKKEIISLTLGLMTMKECDALYTVMTGLGKHLVSPLFPEKSEYLMTTLQNIMYPPGIDDVLGKKGEDKTTAPEFKI